MAMDLISIAEINGPDAKQLREDRALNVSLHSDLPGVVAKQQRAHGERVSARHAVNGQPFAS